MELVLFFLILLGVGMLSYSFCCLLFFGFTGRPVLLAITQSWKLSLSSIIGVMLIGFGAVLLPTLYLNASLEKLPGYNKWRDIFVSVIISVICCIIMVLSVYGLAFEVFG